MSHKQIVVLLLTLLIVIGCGKQKFKVTGQATFPDGTPLPNGIVLFSSDDYSVSGDIRSDGTYELGEITAGDGIRPGKYTVSVASVTKIDPRSNPERPSLIELTDDSFSMDVEVTKSMKLDLTVPRRK